MGFWFLILIFFPYKSARAVPRASGKCKSSYLVLMCLETFFESLLRQKVVRHFK